MANVDSGLEMRILAVSDLDNGIPRGLVGKLKKTKPDLILAGGDLCYGTAIRNIIFKNYKSDKPWYEVVGRRKARQLLKKSAKEGEKVIKYLNNFGVPVCIVIGNNDRTGYKVRKKDWQYVKKDLFRPLIKKYENIRNIDMKKFEYYGLTIIGYGQNNSGPEIPQYKASKKELTRKQLKFLKNRYKKRMKKLNSLFKKAKGENIILLSHNVPFRTKLDKITNPKAPKVVRGKHLGSIIVKDLVKKWRPILSVGGHIHEGQGKQYVGKTLCINDGFGSAGQYAVIDLNGKPKVKFYK